MKALDLTGRRFGMLVAVRRAPRRQGRSQAKTRWEVTCDCGGFAVVDTADLRRTDGRGRVSCGCMNHRRGEASSGWGGVAGISATYWSHIRRGAEDRGLEFSITEVYAHSLFTGRCALTGRSIALGGRRNTTASLDRIDSSAGYIEGNVQWVHKEVNRIKSNMPERDFIQLCKEVASYASRGQ